MALQKAFKLEAACSTLRRDRELGYEKGIILQGRVVTLRGSTVVGTVVPLHRNEVAARRTILVVEDEVLLRMFIADELRNAGYNVLEACSADEALDLLRGQPVQLLFSDIRMPGTMNGMELARAIRSRYPETKVVLTSAESFSADHWTGHGGFFPKPCDTRRLVEHIKMLLGEEHTHGPTR